MLAEMEWRIGVCWLRWSGECAGRIPPSWRRKDSTFVAQQLAGTLKRLQLNDLPEFGHVQPDVTGLADPSIKFGSSIRHHSLQQVC